MFGDILMSVKQTKRGRPLQKQLSQEIIIDQAKQLMLEKGKPPSIRALAAALNVDAMAIYHYFKNKDALLEAVTFSLISDIHDPKSLHWQQEIYELSKSYLAILDKYRGLLQTLLSSKMIGPADVFAARFERITRSLDLNTDTQQTALHLLADYLHGFALAMECNPNRDELNLEMIEQPVTFICKTMVLE